MEDSVDIGPHGRGKVPRVKVVTQKTDAEAKKGNVSLAARIRTRLINTPSSTEPKVSKTSSGVEWGGVIKKSKRFIKT